MSEVADIDAILAKGDVHNVSYGAVMIRNPVRAAMFPLQFAPTNGKPLGEGLPLSERDYNALRAEVLRLREMMK